MMGACIVLGHSSFSIKGNVVLCFDKPFFVVCLHLFEIHKRCVAVFLFFGVFAIKHELRLAAGGQVDCDSPAARVI